MSEIRSFVIGFGLSVLGISLYTQSTTIEPTPSKQLNSNIKISLFKDANTNISTLKLDSIKKETLSVQNQPDTTNMPINNVQSLAYNIDDISTIDGIEDDEILNINTDDIIPIDFNHASSIRDAKPNHNDNTLKVAHLPEESTTINDSTSPWVVAKGGKHLKNKMLIIEDDIKDIELSANSITNKNSDLSFEVAERIKAIDINTLTPIEAIGILYELKKTLGQ